MDRSIPTAATLYDHNAPMMYGTVLRLADGKVAEDAFRDAFIELWDTADKRSQPCSFTRMVQVCIGKTRERCNQGGSTLDFERRLSELAAELGQGRRKPEALRMIPVERTEREVEN